ncbi:hypothetical protein HK103_001783 [Boothiomyces macroporosus]|uniref:NRDE family protein n=1 Tax=Boothiomyces macroporosus TaxID=261099 RepID=A0AAD5UAG3_9FUNG|nr:hypothetical protein HK103_001783 [Boothiomyces macroporosus]
MCVVFICHNMYGYQLVIAANRDEILTRPTLSLFDWGHIIAGQDLKSKGTWLGLTRKGHFGVITNFKEDKRESNSRGVLIPQYLTNPNNFEINDIYSGFNLVVGDLNHSKFYSNRGESLILQGINGLANGHFHDEWPKVTNGKKRFEEILKDGRDLEARLFEFLGTKESGFQSTIFCDPFETPDGLFGTRTQSVVIVKDNHCRFVERNMDGQETVIEFDIE